MFHSELVPKSLADAKSPNHSSSPSPPKTLVQPRVLTPPVPTPLPKTPPKVPTSPVQTPLSKTPPKAPTPALSLSDNKEGAEQAHEDSHRESPVPVRRGRPKGSNKAEQVDRRVTRITCSSAKEAMRPLRSCSKHKAE